MEQANCFGVKKLEFLLFLDGNLSFLFILSVNAICCLLRDEILGRYLVNRMQLANQAPRNKAL